MRVRESMASDINTVTTNATVIWAKTQLKKRIHSSVTARLESLSQGTAVGTLTKNCRQTCAKLLIQRASTARLSGSDSNTDRPLSTTWTNTYKNVRIYTNPKIRYLLTRRTLWYTGSTEASVIGTGFSYPLSPSWQSISCDMNNATIMKRLWVAPSSIKWRKTISTTSQLNQTIPTTSRLCVMSGKESRRRCFKLDVTTAGPRVIRFLKRELPLSGYHRWGVVTKLVSQFTNPRRGSAHRLPVVESKHPGQKMTIRCLISDRTVWTLAVSVYFSNRSFSCRAPNCKLWSLCFDFVRYLILE